MPNFLASWQPSERRDAGAAERTGLENRSRGNSTGGSNPPLSATLSMTYLPTSRLAFPKQNNRSILLDIHPMKLPQSWWWELKLRREGVNN